MVLSTPTLYLCYGLWGIACNNTNLTKKRTAAIADVAVAASATAASAAAAVATTVTAAAVNTTTASVAAAVQILTFTDHWYLDIGYNVSHTYIIPVR